MKKVLFLGACDKSDLILYVSKILTELKGSVLLVDATQSQKYREIAEPMNITEHGIKTEKEIWQFDRFMMCSGVYHDSDLLEMLHENEDDVSNYEWILIDTDQAGLTWSETQELVFVTTYEKPILQQSVQLLDGWFHEHHHQLDSHTFHRVFVHVDCQISEQYIDHIIAHTIPWKEPSHYIEYDEIDIAAKIDNQYRSDIKMNKLSPTYQQTLRSLVQGISRSSKKEVMKAFKKAKKGK